MLQAGGRDEESKRLLDGGAGSSGSAAGGPLSPTQRASSGTQLQQHRAS